MPDCGLISGLFIWLDCMLLIELNYLLSELRVDRPLETLMNALWVLIQNFNFIPIEFA